jgi:hypothetical protein
VVFFVFGAEIAPLPKGETIMAQFDELGSVLDKESWEWLDTYHPTVAEMLDKEIARGASADAIRNFVRKRVGVHRDEFAIRCEAAARHLESQKKA